LFVADDSGDGVARLLENRAGWATLEYFVSPVGPRTEKRRVPAESVRPVDLPSQTLVYWYDEAKTSWRIGRTDGEPISAQALQKSEDHYIVRFPNSDVTRLPQSALRVRWARPIDDPTDLIAARVTESPFFAVGRQRLTKFLARQQALCRGVVGLSASAIEYHPHQLATVQRVLKDPVQRYILADEVGLGKTIEAGILIKQFLATEGTQASVLVLAPAHLLSQWKQELSSKFFVQEDGEQVRIEALEQLTETSEPATMLVVDEAHRGARWAFAENPEDQRRYKHLVRLARTAKRSFLLSGTPLHQEEDGFLAMLHLIDPTAYPLNEREQFRRRVQARETVGATVGDLADDGEASFVAEAIDRLQSAFTDDPLLLKLSNDVKAVCEEPRESPARKSSLRALRAHVIEVYRLHRRLLRTRRDDRSVSAMLPKRDGCEWLAVDTDPARAAADEFLEDFRRNVAEARISDAAEPFAAFVSAALSHPEALRKALTGREEQLRANAGRAFFASELETIRSWRKRFDELAIELDPRVARLASWLGEKRRAVVFVDEASVAVRTAQELAQRISGRVVVQAAGNERDIRSFHEGDARVLVVNGDSEEGLNLQECRASLVLFDVPMAPLRIEQRIGRVDRLEGLKRLSFIGFKGVGQYEKAWQDLLERSIRVFHRSIAPLQYALSASVRRVSRSLIEEGASAFSDEAITLLDAKSGLEAELRRIRAQEALDSLEWDVALEREFAEDLESAADDSAECGAEAFDAWLSTCLQFEHRGSDPFHYVFHLAESGPKFARSRPSLLPLQQVLASDLADFIDRDAREGKKDFPLGPFTFDRDVAAEGTAGLLRVGHPFVKAVEQQLRTDDRGVAWALWRAAPDLDLDGPEICIGFDFIVEADPAPAAPLLDQAAGSHGALRMVLEAFFKPLALTFWVDIDGNHITDGELLKALNRPYQAQKKGGSDVNLRFDRWNAVDEARPINDWAERCRRARSIADKALRDDPRFAETIQRARALIADQAELTAGVLRSRISRLTGAARAAEEYELTRRARLDAALLHGAATPRIRVDSAGVVVLAKNVLPGAE
jgi:ATP-dependent helicase HepA